jgi:hypothetical protein
MSKNCFKNAYLSGDLCSGSFRKRRNRCRRIEDYLEIVIRIYIVFVEAGTFSLQQQNEK